jgi:hypothetical protein
MKRKNRDWTEVEQRLGAGGSQILQDNGMVRATLLAIVTLGVAVLAWMAVYLVCLSSPLQDDPAASAMRTWRSV